MLKSNLNILVVAILLFTGGCSHRGVIKRSPGDEFAKGFYDEKYIQEYIQSIDSLKVLARNHIRSSVEQRINTQFLPSISTSNGILFVYTIDQFENGYIHHVSISRAPYLATPFAKFLVALVCERTGLPVPHKIQMTPRAIYHANWILTAEQHASLEAKLPVINDISAKDVGAKALLATLSIEIEHIKLPSLDE